MLEKVKGKFLKPKLGHEDVNIDDVPVRNNAVGDVVHGQLQHGAQRSNQRLHLSNNTDYHVVLPTLDDVKGIVDVPVKNVIDDLHGVRVREIRRCGRPQEHDFFWFGEFSEGGK